MLVILLIKYKNKHSNMCVVFQEFWEMLVVLCLYSIAKKKYSKDLENCIFLMQCRQVNVR